MKDTYVLFTTERGLVNHWAFKLIGSVILTVIWRLAENTLLPFIWIGLIGMYGFGGEAVISQLMTLPWFADLILAYICMWLGSLWWRRREQKLKYADPPVTPMISWYMNFAFGLTVFLFTQALIIGLRVMLVLGKPY